MVLFRADTGWEFRKKEYTRTLKVFVKRDVHKKFIFERKIMGCRIGSAAHCVSGLVKQDQSSMSISTLSTAIEGSLKFSPTKR